MLLLFVAENEQATQKELTIKSQIKRWPPSTGKNLNKYIYLVVFVFKLNFYLKVRLLSSSGPSSSGSESVIYLCVPKLYVIY